MRPLIAKIKPASGFSRVAHIVLNALLALVVFVLVRIDFIQLALAIILLSKWRMFAVRPRFWPANIRANSIDIIVSVSILLFLVHSGNTWLQLVWTLVYALWLLVIKPASSGLLISIQAMTGLLFGMTALFLGWGNSTLYLLVLASATISYLAARHFFDAFDEPYARLLSYLWAYFTAATVWILCHWLLFYGFLAQPTLLLTALGYGLVALYYLDHHDKLSRLAQLEIIITTCAIVFAVIISLTVNVSTTVHALLH